MECPRFAEEKAGESESPEFLDHLAGCPACRRDLEDYEEIGALYREASVERYPGGVPALSSRWSKRWLAAFAASAMVVAVLVSLPVRREAPAFAGPVRLRSEPWSRADVEWDRNMDELWERLETLERRPR